MVQNARFEAWICLDIFGAKISSKHLVLIVAFAESPKCVDRTLCYTKFGRVVTFGQVFSLLLLSQVLGRIFHKVSMQ